MLIGQLRDYSKEELDTARVNIKQWAVDNNLDAGEAQNLIYMLGIEPDPEAKVSREVTNKKRGHHDKVA